MSYSGKYLPQNTKKYRGNINKIQYRSSWELYFMKWLDNNEAVKWWNSEETIIPYFSRIDQKNRRYFMDFTVCFVDSSGFDKIVLFEVKPLKETMPPKPPPRMTEKAKGRMLKEVHTFETNIDKWKATKTLCDKKNWEFKIITEVTLKKMGMKMIK